ncbi:M56 family metallopeptidase [Kitasatospora nipponensis]
MVTWAALVLSFAAAVVMVVHAVSEPGHLRERPGRWLAWASAASPAEGAAGHDQALLLGSLAVMAVASVVGAGWVRAARIRARHRAVLAVASRQDAENDWCVVEDNRPAVWCVPGCGGQVVLTRGALQRLAPAHREAVVAHERAHLAGRHHLCVGAAKALGSAFSWLPLARRMAQQVPVLAEMAADDAALRHCTPRVLAEALCIVAGGGTPSGTLAAGSQAAVQRVHRLLQPTGPLPFAVRGAWWAALAVLPVVPVLLACGP